MSTENRMEIAEFYLQSTIGPYEPVYGGISNNGATGLKDGKPYVHVSAIDRTDDGQIFIEFWSHAPKRNDMPGWGSLFDGPYHAQYYFKGDVIFVMDWFQLRHKLLTLKLEPKFYDFKGGRNSASGVFIDRDFWWPHRVKTINVEPGTWLGKTKSIQAWKEQAYAAK